MKLYSGPLSLFSGKARIALDEKGLDYELVSVPFSRARGYEPKHEVVLAHNPKQQVPVLVDGDLVVFDSTLIFEYLEDRYPKPPLYPADPAGRARCRQLEAAADEILFPHVLDLIRQVFYVPGGGRRDEDVVAPSRAAIGEHYAGLDARLDGRRHLCGDFSVADISYFLTVTFASGLGAPIGDGQRHLRAWYDRLLERPSVSKEFAGLMSAMERASAA